ncbi:MAG: VIT1/CCC1 transporter family protein [Candidatus Thorarchaeota archaeon]
MLKQLKIYNQITHFSLIARRYFVNNFYDGMLTILGILLGFFVLILRNESISAVDSSYVILTCLGTSLSMFISGISGSYLSERAERRKEKKEIDKAMVILEEEENESLIIEKVDSDASIQKAMITPINMNNSFDNMKIQHKKPKLKKRAKTLYEKAEKFTNVIVSIVNGTAPLVGGIIPSLPFFFVLNAGIPIFLLSFLIITICIIFLGIVLGLISKESILRNVIEMTFAFFLTFIITLLILRI